MGGITICLTRGRRLCFYRGGVHAVDPERGGTGQHRWPVRHHFGQWQYLRRLQFVPERGFLSDEAHAVSRGFGLAEYRVTAGELLSGTGQPPVPSPGPTAPGDSPPCRPELRSTTRKRSSVTRQFCAGR